MLTVTREPANRELYSSLVLYFGIQSPTVPFIVIGGRYIQGYNDAATTGADIKNAVPACLQNSCSDLVRPLLSGEEHHELSGPVFKPMEVPKILKLPVFGAISLAHLDADADAGRLA